MFFGNSKITLKLATNFYGSQKKIEYGEENDQFKLKKVLNIMNKFIEVVSSHMQLFLKTND